jgi:hypothetical protein
MESQSKKETKTSESNSVDDDALILRLALFQSISAFCPLFYIAFWMGDWDRLQDVSLRKNVAESMNSLYPFSGLIHSNQIR